MFVCISHCLSDYSGDLKGYLSLWKLLNNGCGIGDTCDVCTQQFGGQANVLTEFGKWGEQHNLTWGMFSNWGRVLAGYR